MGVFFVSLLLHAILWSGAYWTAVLLPSNEPIVFRAQQDFIEFDVVKKIEPLEVVPQLVVPPEQIKLLELEKKVKLLSEKLQRVKKETQAQNVGPSENNIVSQKIVTQKIDRPTDINKLNDTKNFKFGESGEFFPPPALSRNSLSSTSQFNHSLNERIPLGEMTVLNTDQYVYYSFYSRIDKLVYTRWTSRVMLLQNYLSAAEGMTSENSWTTFIEFLMDPKGNLLNSIVLKSSGIRELDGAAINSFKEVGVFPNPPVGMIQEDGLVHVQIHFTVRKPSTLVGSN